MNSRILLIATAATAAAIGGTAWWHSRPAAQAAADAVPAEQRPTADHLTGRIRIAGSHNVAPLTRLALAGFTAGAPGVETQAITSTSGHGLRRLLADQIEVANASRPVNDKELAIARGNGQQLIELTMALSATAVVVSPANAFAKDLSADELASLWIDGSRVSRWSDLRPGWPEEKVVLIARDKDSTLHENFVQSILGKNRQMRQDVGTAVEPEEAVAQVTASPYAVTILQYDELKAQAGKVRILAVDGGYGPVLPTPESIRDGTYTPLVRPMVVYVTARNADRSEVDAFLGSYLAAAPALAPQAGMIPLSDAAYRIEAERLRRRIGGTIY